MADREKINSLFDEVISRLPETKSDREGHEELINHRQVRFSYLKAQFNKCMDINDRCIAGMVDPLGMEYDEQTETFWGIVDGKRVTLLKLERADPNVPIRMKSTSSHAAFIPRTGEAKPPALLDTGDDQRQLASETEAYYYAANKAWEHIETGINSRSNPKFIGVKMVRNKLFEHSIKAELNSFGANSDIGPQVKPMRRTKTKDAAPYDAGMVPNTEELLTACLRRISAAST